MLHRAQISLAAVALHISLYSRFIDRLAVWLAVWLVDLQTDLLSPKVDIPLFAAAL